MERTLFQLTQAICAYRIGVVHAPSQYGRSSTVQTLAQVCVQEIIVSLKIKRLFLVMWNKLC